MDVRGKKIFVGLSGGVDSGVSATLLQEAGADVTGVFIKGWYPPGLPCMWAADRRDAMRVAAHLRIPFVTLDASAEYKRGVIDYLLREYAAGRTPNPDVFCNKEVKFGTFYEFAKKNNALIAMGHYAQLLENPETNEVQLARGIDESKDQSYFLWAVSREALAHTLFPVGSMPKPSVRELAVKFSLPVATKKDSQGICFLGSISVDDFLRAELETTPGKIVDPEGTELGTHDGAVLYTLGERIAIQNALGGPWYVVQKDIKNNLLTASQTLATTTVQKTIVLDSVNIFNEIKPDEKITAQYRYHGPKIQGNFRISENIFEPIHALSERLASGQSLVLYKDNFCIGGGIIA